MKCGKHDYEANDKCPQGGRHQWVVAEQQRMSESRGSFRPAARASAPAPETPPPVSPAPETPAPETPPTPHQEPPSQGLQLKYWAGRGLMEVPRMVLAVAGKFPSEGAYLDSRYTTDEALTDGRTHLYSDASRTLTANLGRLPVAEWAGEAVGQSAAINFLVASECGLMGDSNIEAAQIINIAEHVKEMMLAFRGVLPYGTEPTPEALDKWFDGGAEDASPEPADMKRRSERFLKWWTGRIEACVGGGGFAVGDRISLADVIIYNAFWEHLQDHEAAGPAAEAAWRRQAFCDGQRTEDRIAECPRLHAICHQVASHPNVQRWLAERGVQRF